MPKQNLPESDRTTWKVFAVIALAMGIFLAWQALHSPSAAQSNTPAPDTANSQAQNQAAPPASVTAQRGKNKAGKELPPDFWLKEIFSGKEIRLSKYQGKVVLVDFWATWCGPCRMELPHFVELQDAYKKKGFSMIGVSLDQQGEEIVQNFAKQWKINYPIVVDGSGEVSYAFGGIRAIPSTYLIGRDGTIKETFVGYRPKEQFEDAIKKALNEKI
jgi:thiol-disulfide isomerase/thioredoxin